jgi:hypothetical protein
MDTSDYCLLMRMIRTSERPSNAESQNVGFSSLIGSTSSVSTTKPRIPANQLIRERLLTAGLNKQFQGGYITDSRCYQCAGPGLEEYREGGDYSWDQVGVVYLRSAL